MSSGAYHYQKDGEWKDIDTRWLSSQDPAWDYQMVDAQYQAYVKEQFGFQAMVRLEKVGHHLEFQPMELSVVPEKGDAIVIAQPRAVKGEVVNGEVDIISPGGYIEWKGAYGEGLDLRYTPSDTRFIKVLKVKSKDALAGALEAEGEGRKLVMKVRFQTDLQMVSEGKVLTGEATTRDVEFKDDKGQVQWEWRTPRAWDSAQSQVQGEFIIKPVSEKVYEVAIHFAQDWFKNAQYPVYVDPDTYYGNTDDGYIYGRHATNYATARATSDFYSDTELYFYVGQFAPVFGNFDYRVHRGYINFDTSAIGSGTILSAQLFMKANHVYFESFTVQIHKYNWSAPIWNNQESKYDGALASAYDVDWKAVTNMLPLQVYHGSQNLNISWINRSGLTKYVLLSNKDVLAIAPTSGQYIELYSNNSGVINGPYLSITLLTCGNGVLNTGEQCDDGNGIDGDGCNILCQIVSGYKCTGAPSVCVKLTSDCGLRGFDGTNILKFACETVDPPTSPLRINTPSSGLRGIVLVDPTDLLATKFRIRTAVGTKALSVDFKCGASLVTDSQGNSYSTVQIGGQCWMKDNLRLGTMLASASDNPQNNGVVEKWCHGTDNTSSQSNAATCISHGGLYTWNEAMKYTTTNGVQGICPDGWHIPTDNEFKILEMYLGMTQAQADLEDWRGNNEGTKLKEGGSSGFNAKLAGGVNHVNGLFYYWNLDGIFWTSTQVTGTEARSRLVESSYITVLRYQGGHDKRQGWSVRCLKN